MEELIDTVTAVCPDDTAIPTLGMLLNNVPVLAEQSTRLDDVNGLGQALSRCLCHANSIWVGQSLISNVIRLVQVTVKAAVVESDINIQDIAILEYALVGNAVTNNLVD